MVEAAPPLITVGLVTYNRAHLVGRAIQSVLNQSYANYELIVSDDNSTDDTAEVVSRFMSDERVKYIKRSGVGMTQNFVDTLHDARGEYFIWLCDDDYFGDSYLEVCQRFLQAHPDYSLVAGKTRFFKGDALLERAEIFHLECNDASQRVVKYFRNVNSNIFLYGLMRTKDISNIIYPDTFCADLLWSAQVVFFGKAKILEEISFFYSVSGISETTIGLKEYYQTTKARSVNPYSVLRRDLMGLVFNRRSVFRRLSSIQKIRLSISLGFVLRERFLMPAYEARLRGFLKIRTRLRTLFR